MYREVNDRNATNPLDLPIFQLFLIQWKIRKNVFQLKWTCVHFFVFIPRSPIAVGVTTVSRKDMFEDGMRGKGVMILHVFTDFLW